MKKFLIILILLLIIILTSGYSFLKVSANGDEGNYFNMELRERFASNGLARKVIGLHYDGDAKSDYLGNKYDQIEIVVSLMDGVRMDKEVLNDFVQRVEKATGKKTSYKYVGMSSFESVSTIDSLEKKIETLKYSSPKAVLYLLVAGSLKGEGQQIGSTIMEDGIVFFENTMKKNMHEENEEDLNRYLVGTLTHEFGHQLGLGHNKEKDCLMNETIEFTNIRASEVVDYFCSEELKKILKIKSEISQ